MTTTVADLRVTPRYDEEDRYYATRHLFLATEDTALCGHASTADQPRRVLDETDDHPTQILSTCSHCVTSLTSTTGRIDYESQEPIWNDLAQLEEWHRVEVTFEDGETVDAAVTETVDTSSKFGRRTVRFTSDPGTLGYLRDYDDDFSVRAYEGEVYATYLLGDRSDEERPVSRIETVGHAHPADDDDPADVLALTERCEQLAAHFERMARDEDDDSLQQLRILNTARPLADASHRLRHEDWPLAWVRQKAENRCKGLADTLVDHPHGDEKRAKLVGKVDGHSMLAGELDDLLGDDDEEPSVEELHCSAYDWCGGVPTYPTGACNQHADEVADDDDTEAVTDGGRPDLAQLETGDAFELPNGVELVVVGVAPADEAPDSASDGPLYAAELRRPGVRPKTTTHLYRPHNIRQGVEGGAEYVGQRDVDDERTPFWCDGCDYSHTADDRRDTMRDDVAACSYGCEIRAEAERRQRKRAERQRDDLDLVTDGGRSLAQLASDGQVQGTAVTHPEFGDGEVVDKDLGDGRLGVEFGDRPGVEWCVPEALEIAWSYYEENPTHATEALEPFTAAESNESDDPDHAYIEDALGALNSVDDDELTQREARRLYEAREIISQVEQNVRERLLGHELDHLRSDVRDSARYELTRDCRACGDETTHQLFQQYPATTTTGAWGKYLNPVYRCQSCETASVLLCYETTQDAERPEWGAFPPEAEQ